MRQFTPQNWGLSWLLRQRLEDIPASWRKKLDRLFGTADWQVAFYKADPQGVFPAFEDASACKVSQPIRTISKFYQERLATIFPKVAPEPRCLCNSKNSPMFILTFAVASQGQRAQDLAMKLARHVLKSTY